MTPIMFLLLVLGIAVVLLAVITSASSRRHTRSSAHPRHQTLSAPTLTRAQISDRWTTIQAMAAGGGNGLRQAVSEADKLLDQALRQAGVPGATLGERLKAARPRFSEYDAYDRLWRAHKLRNALAHEVGFDLVPSQAREALSDFERGLRVLGAL